MKNVAATVIIAVIQNVGSWVLEVVPVIAHVILVVAL